MTRRLPAFATLAAVGILAISAALLYGGVLSSEQLLVDQGRAEHEMSTRAAGWKAIDSTLSLLSSTWNADEQTFDAWNKAHAQALPDGLSLLSLSGRMNLNSVTPFIMQNSSLSGTLLGHSVLEFTDDRMNKGPFTRLSDYKAYFRPQALKALYSVHSSFDINTVDEIIAEKIITARTGNAAFAANVRARMRQFRTNKQAMTESDLTMLLGNEKDALGDLITVRPELDVNTASLDLLQALLRDPDFSLEQPDAKAQTIVNLRSNKPWTDEALRQTMGLPTSSQLMQYLGTRCYFIEASLSQGDRVAFFVVKIGYSSDSPPKLNCRVIETRSEPKS
jgi:hypothetical protein